MPVTTRSVPVARRQLLAEPAKLVVTLSAVAAAVALVLLLSGLRRGMGEQVTLYIDHQAPVLVGRLGARDFLSQTSVLREGLAQDLERVPGVAQATPISQQYAMFRLHERRVLLAPKYLIAISAGAVTAVAAGALAMALLAALLPARLLARLDPASAFRR